MNYTLGPRYQGPRPISPGLSCPGLAWPRAPPARNGEAVGRQEKASSELVSEPQQGLVSQWPGPPCQRACQPSCVNTGARLAELGHRGDRPELLLPGLDMAEGARLPVDFLPECRRLPPGPPEPQARRAFLETRVVLRPVSLLQTPVLFLFCFCLQHPGFTVPAARPQRSLHPGGGKSRVSLVMQVCPDLRP